MERCDNDGEIVLHGSPGKHFSCEIRGVLCLVRKIGDFIECINHGNVKEDNYQLNDLGIYTRDAVALSL